MHKSDTNRGEISFGLGWYLLGDYPLSIFLPFSEKDELGAGKLLSHAIQEWGLPGECVQNIERIGKDILVEALSHRKSKRSDLPGRIRVFIQMKKIGQEIKGGWGYFVIEPSRDTSSGNCLEPLYDIYIYEEGG
jgi:hypothetical protein